MSLFKNIIKTILFQTSIPLIFQTCKDLKINRCLYIFSWNEHWSETCNVITLGSSLCECYLNYFYQSLVVTQPFIPLTPCVHNNCGQNIGPLFNNRWKAYWVQRWIPSFTVGNACPCSESATHGYCEEKCTSIYN